MRGFVFTTLLALAAPLPAGAAWNVATRVHGAVTRCDVTAGDRGAWISIATSTERPGALRLVMARHAWRGPNGGLPFEIRFGAGSMMVLPATRSGDRIHAEIPATEAKYFLRDGAAGGPAQLVLPGERVPAWTLDLSGATHALSVGGRCFAVAPQAPLRVARAPDANLSKVAAEDLPAPVPAAPAPAAPKPQTRAVAPATAPTPEPAPEPDTEATPAQVAAAQLAASQHMATEKAAQDAVAQKTQALNALLSGIMAQSYQQLKSAGVQFDDASALFNALLLAKPDFESFTPPVQVTTDDTGYIGNFVEVTPQGYTDYAGGFAPHGTESLVTISGRLQTVGGGCSYVVGLVALSKLPNVKQLGGKPAYETYACDGLLAHQDDDAIGKRVFGFTARVIKDPASVR